MKINHSYLDLVKNESADKFQYFRFSLHHQRQEMGGRRQAGGPQQSRSNLSGLGRRGGYIQEELQVYIGEEEVHQRLLYRLKESIRDQEHRCPHRAGPATSL